MLNGLDLFSGIGGITLALAPWVRPIAYCENDRYAHAVLLSRMADGRLPVAPIWDDVRTLGGRMLPPVDIIYGGFPCQDISVAANGRGVEGERSGLVFELLRLVRECRPAYVFLENSPGIRTRGAERVIGELAAGGYDARWLTLTAAEVGACHKRNRWWLLAANTDQIARRLQSGRRIGSHWTEERGPPWARKSGQASWAPDGFSAPSVARAGNGVPYRLDRAGALGNAVVPQCAREAFIRLSGIGG